MRAFNRLARLVGRESSPASLALTPDMRFTIDPETRITGGHEDGRTVMHLEAGRVWAINGLGSDVWQRLADGLTTSEIVADLAARYDAPAERIANDVTAFVEKLVALKLIRPTVN